MNNFFQSKIFKLGALIAGVMAVTLLVFYAGIQVGSRKSDFSRAWGENYQRNFGPNNGGNGAMMGLPGDEPIGGHGTFGQIIKINLPQIVITSQQDAEKVVVVGDDTQIRQLRGFIEPSDLKVGDMVVVIGAPNASGSIDAGLIRILPPAPEASSTNQ